MATICQSVLPELSTYCDQPYPGGRGVLKGFPACVPFAGVVFVVPEGEVDALLFLSLLLFLFLFTSGVTDG